MLDRISKMTATQDESIGVDAQTIESGKMLATIGYVLWPVALLPLIKKDNAYSLYHARQAVALLVAAVAAMIPLWGIFFVFAIIKLGVVAMILSLAFTAVALGFVVVGAMNAWNGRVRPLPLLSGLVQRLFGREASLAQA
ncbi:MAG: hypothetical protein AMXMBFR47_39870 [Planctomycetota bacterium]